MPDRMIRIVQELTILGITTSPTSVPSTFVPQLHDGFNVEDRLLQGQDPNREDNLQRVKARYDFF